MYFLSEKRKRRKVVVSTIASVFGTVYTADVKGSTNRELFATDNPQILQVLQENEKKLQSKDLEQMMGTVLAGCTPYEAGSYIMTDDKAPVELLGIKVIDQLI